MGTKPSLTLELDGHTADAGVNTRIDAALDIIHNYRKISTQIKDTDYSDFRMATVDLNSEIGIYVSSDGERIPLNDPRVVVLIPSMGDLASPLFAASLKSHGINAEALPEGNSEILKYGRAYTTGKECLPVILLAGSMIDYIENRWDGKKHVAFFNISSSGNCRIGQYPVILRDIVKRKRLRNVAPFELVSDNGYAGLGENFAKTGIHALFISDVLDDIRSGIMANAVDPERGLEIFNEEYKKLLDNFTDDLSIVNSNVETFAKHIKARIPARIPIEQSKYIALTGEIFVRRDAFSHKWLNKYFAKKGFILKNAYITEWIYYVDFLLKYNLIEPERSMKDKVERYIRGFYMRQAEKKIKKMLAKSGYYHYTKTDVEGIVKHTTHIFPLEIKGEACLTLGTALYDTLEEFCGVVNIGPFGCMPTRFSEAVAATEMKVENKVHAMKQHDPNYAISKVFNGNMNIPFLTIETDGNVYPQVIEARLETFALQSERVSQLMKKSKTNGYAVHKDLKNIKLVGKEIIEKQDK
jgi:predicted nucleotide-binding protein (sugar kinase/HSP70/actin superfamily)